jgi:hypothetical protein
MKTALLPTIEPTVPECKGCNKEYKRDEKYYCQVYLTPALQWRNVGIADAVGSVCLLASHVKTSIAPKMGKTRVGQQKQKRIKA